jgi:hypothetical protein
MSTPNPDDSQFEDFIEEPAPKPSNNRNFYIAIGIIGFMTVVILVVLVIVATMVVPAQNAKRNAEAAHIYAANTATSIAATQQEATQQFLRTPSITPTPTNPPLPTATPVLAQGSPTSATLSAADAAQTATIEAMLTSAPTGGPTTTGTPGNLPNTGFADDYGIPLMVGLTIVFLVIILLSRKLRSSSSA